MTNKPHQLTENTKLLHKVAIIHNDEILILQRHENALSRPGKWDLAGGNSEWPEESRHGQGIHKEDVVREIVEETGINVDVNSFEFPALSFFDTFFDAQKQVFTILCGWKYNLPSDFDRNQVKISHEHSNAQWVKIEQLENINFGGDKGEWIKNIAKTEF